METRISSESKQRLDRTHVRCYEAMQETSSKAGPHQKMRILVADDHPLVRDGLMSLISLQSDMVCCGQAGSAAEILAAAASRTPDLVILDLKLKDGDGLAVIRSLRSQFPSLRILILSQYESPLYVEGALKAGAMGYLVKDQAANEVIEAIRSVLSGYIYLTRRMAALFWRKLIGSPAKACRAGVEPLTDRELDVWQLLGAGMSTQEIAAELSVGPKTVETHRENIKHKLGFRGAAELMHYATAWAKEPVSFEAPELCAA